MANTAEALLISSKRNKIPSSSRRGKKVDFFYILCPYGCCCRCHRAHRCSLGPMEASLWATVCLFVCLTASLPLFSTKDVATVSSVVMSDRVTMSSHSTDGKTPTTRTGDDRRITKRPRASPCRRRVLFQPPLLSPSLRLPLS